MAGSPLADYTFALNGDSKGILITGTEAIGATKNGEVITGDVAVVKNDVSIAGVTFAAGNKEKATLTITGPKVLASGKVELVLANPAVTVSVDVVKDQTAADVAAKLAAALTTAGVTGYAVSNVPGSADIVFDATTSGDKDNLTATISNK